MGMSIGWPYIQGLEIADQSIGATRGPRPNTGRAFPCGPPLRWLGDLHLVLRGIAG